MKYYFHKIIMNSMIFLLILEVLPQNVTQALSRHTIQFTSIPWYILQNLAHTLMSILATPQNELKYPISMERCGAIS